MNGVQFTPAEKAMLARFDEVEELAFVLEHLPQADFRAFVDALPSDSPELAVARQEATELVDLLGRSDELASADRLLE